MRTPTESPQRAPTPGRTPARPPRRLGAALLVGLLLAGGGLLALTSGPTASAPAEPGGVPAPVALAPTPIAAAHAASGSPYLGCDGMYWTSGYNASYTPSFCYGHDEPTLSYLSTTPGSGANASFPITLPSDSSSYAQGQFYATIWFGGTVYDTASTSGGNQAFLELQLYPAGPFYTGAGSGSKDCLPNGAFSPSYSAGANKWFACAIVWQLATIGGSTVEDAGFAGPIDSGTSTAILTMHSNDHLFVNYSGVAQSPTVPWNISIRDTTTGTGGWAVLKNGSLVLSPYYSTAAAGNSLKWGASNPGAIAFAYEIGHSYTTSGCSPGDGVCDSYWPVRWSQSGQLALGLPTMGSPSVASFPRKMTFSSSQGGEYEVNGSTCGSPSTSTSTNCLYPYFAYRSGSYAFDFGTGSAANMTHPYGGIYQYPATLNGGGQWNGNTQVAPWGTVRFVIYPSNATAQFNPQGGTTTLALPANRTLAKDFLEGLYYLNVSAPGCSRHATTLYLGAGAVDNVSIFLPCGGNTLSASATATPTSGKFPLPVTFNATATGGLAPYNFSWSFGDGSGGFGAGPSHTYALPGTYNASVIVSDSGVNGTVASVLVSVHEPSCAGANRTLPLGTAQYCHLNKGQSVIFEFNVSKNDWFQNGWIDVYSTQGSATGKLPFFEMGAGLGGSPTIGHAKAKAFSPSAHIQILLNNQRPNKWGGWGTYWVVVKAINGSGGFCYVAGFGNGSLPSKPTCPSSVNLPRSGTPGGPGGSGTGGDAMGLPTTAPPAGSGLATPTGTGRGAAAPGPRAWRIDPGGAR